MKDKDKIALQKIVGYIDDTFTCINGVDFDSFLQDKKTLFACAFAVSQIGELANELSLEIRNSNPDIPWKSIKGMRNKIVHDYETIDFTVLWKTIELSLPELKNQLGGLLEKPELAPL